MSPVSTHDPVHSHALTLLQHQSSDHYKHPSSASKQKCHSAVALALGETDLNMKSAEGHYWPEPEPPLLLVLDPASDAPVAAVLAEPASHVFISWTHFLVCLRTPLLVFSCALRYSLTR